MSRRESSAPPMEALVHDDELCAPAPGYFRLLIGPEHLVAPGDLIGELEVLGRSIPISSTRLRGIVKVPPGTPLGRRAVSYGEVLVRVATDVTISGADAAAASSARAEHGLVFRAPTSGRFYGRPSPDKPAFVEIGRELAAGTTVCLLEVMKTFHRVTYGGHDVPPRAKVKELLVADGADVNQGDPLLALESI